MNLPLFVKLNPAIQRLLGVVSLFFSIATARGESPELALVGGLIHPVSGPAIANGVLVINQKGLIASVGTNSPSTEVQKVDLAGLHLFPGLIASATTLGLVEIDAVRATVDSHEVGEFVPEIQAWKAVNPDSEIIPVTRANGISHAEVMPAGVPFAGYSSLIQLSGWTIENLAYRRLVGLHVYWPSFSLDLAPKSARGDGWKSVEDQIKERNVELRKLDEYVDQADAWLKLRDVHSAETNFAMVPAWEGMRPVLRGTTPVLIHADGVAEIQSAVEWLVRRKLRGAIVGGRDAARCSDCLATNHVPVIYTAEYTLPPRDTDPYDVQYATPARLTKAGVTVIFGDGGGGTGSFVRNLPYTAAQAVAFGMPPEDALKALTLNPAMLFGDGLTLGSLEPGKDATLIATDGDILDPKTSVKRMWIGGKEVDLSSRHTRLYEKYRNRPKS